MARNQEKAQAMLNRFLQYKRDQLYGKQGRRPAFARDCHDLGEAERWRRTIIKEISKEVTEIQNGSLGEHKIRDLNDHINKLIREKRHWERQIKMLGGPDYTRQSYRVGGQGAIGSRGYLYFGAARDLPGVRELFEKQVADSAPRKKRKDLSKLVDAEYYGFGGEDDESLVRVEQKVEVKARKRAIKAWNEANRKRARVGKSGAEAGPGYDGSKEASRGTGLKAHVPLPSDEEISKALLARKKAELLKKYVNR